jgi:ATP-dependent DNA ligase
VLPRNLRPLRLSRRPEPFDSDDYIFELKIDGFRSLAYIENGECDLVSRNSNTFRNFKDLTQWIGDNLRIENAVVGEFHRSSGDGSLIEAATVLLPPV